MVKRHHLWSHCPRTRLPPTAGTSFRNSSRKTFHYPPGSSGKFWLDFSPPRKHFSPIAVVVKSAWISGIKKIERLWNYFVKFVPWWSEILKDWNHWGRWTMMFKKYIIWFHPKISIQVRSTLFYNIKYIMPGVFPLVIKLASHQLESQFAIKNDWQLFVE